MEKIYAVITRAFLFMFALWALLMTSMTTPRYFEIDSYALPMISMQYHHSLIMTPEDLQIAQQDFSTLYAGVNSYDDLRSSKLNQLDETHWVSYYFPAYAVVCFPAKLFLQIFGLNQEYCFTITNALFLILALYLVARKKFESKGQNLLLLALFCCSPIVAYITYIGAEPVLFAMTIIMMLCWSDKRYYAAALIISFSCMPNPTYMGFGIILFLEYLHTSWRNNHDMLLNREWWKKTLLLCSCYIPSLIPFVFNRKVLGVWNPTTRAAFAETGDLWIQRVLSYVFDINFGIGSISFVVIVIFFCGIFWSLIHGNISLFLQCFSVLFVIGLFSLMNHINSGMIRCARYVLWVYPACAFLVCIFLREIMVSHNVKEQRPLKIIGGGSGFSMYNKQCFSVAL